MIETRIKVIKVKEDLLPDPYFQDSTKWTLSEAGPNGLANAAFINNRDIELRANYKNAANLAKAVANGVTLDTTKQYVVTFKLNKRDTKRSRVTICGVELTSLPIGKQVTRVLKPTTSTVELMLQCNNPFPSSSLASNLWYDVITFDYFDIYQYDVDYLDLLKTEPILYQSNVKDIYEPDKIKSDYTKSFDIPGTYKNNLFFNHWYKVTAKGDFDVTAKTFVVIQKKETDLIEGYMTLNNVKIEGSKILYNVTIIAEMANIWNDIDTLKLTDLDFSEFNHELNMKKLFVELPRDGSVSAGSSANPTAVNTIWTYETTKIGTGKGLILPNGTSRVQITITNHGYSEGDFVRVTNYQSGNTVPPMNGDCVVEGVFDANNFYVSMNYVLAAGSNAPFPFFVKKKNFTGNGWYYGAVNRGLSTKNQLVPSKSKPSFFVKGIIDKIFKDAGYRYQSSFFNTNYFKSLLVDVLTKEVTQTSDAMGNQTCEVKSVYTETNPQLGTTANAHFIQYSKAVNVPGTGKFPKTLVGTNFTYGAPGSQKFYYEDIIFNTETSDPTNIYGADGYFYPKSNGDYSFDIKLTVGMAIQNPTSIAQYIVPYKQIFAKTSHIPLVDADLDGTPSKVEAPKIEWSDPNLQANSGVQVRIEIVDGKDVVQWSSPWKVITPASRTVGGYNYQENTADIIQKVALPLKKGSKYKIRMKYARNAKLCMGSESNEQKRYRWGISSWENFPIGMGTYYTNKPPKSPSSYNDNGFSVFLVGDNQQYKKKLNSPDNTTTQTVTGYNWCKFELLQSVAEGSDIFINNFVADMEQKDFLTSINKMFNLYWYWDRNNRRYIIEPFYGFYNQDELDWTRKVAKDKEIVMEPLDNDKKYLLQYKESNDYYNKDYRDKFGYSYGDSVVVNASDIATNENKIQTSFSLGVLVGFPEKPYNDMVVPTYTSAALTINNSTTGDNSEAVRIYICGGQKYTATGMYLDDESSLKQTYEGLKYDQYPFMGHIDDVYAPYYDLCYANPAQFTYIARNYTTHNLYNKYWRDWFNLILNKEQKMVTFYMRLNDTDIFNLDYAKRYVINKEPFRLVSVSDHNLSANNLAVVTFIKDYSSKQYVPKTLANDGGTNPWVVNGRKFEDDPWSSGNPWIGAVYDEWNTGGFREFNVTSYTVQGNMFSSGSPTTMTPINTFDRGLGIGGNAASFESVSLGTYNRDFGSENFISGNNNRVYSSRNIVTGTNNEVSAQNTIVLGDNIKASRPGIYFSDTYISPEGVVHNATNVINGGQGETTGYYETVNNLYKPNVIGLISGSGSTTNPYAGVLRIDNPNIPFSRISGTDIRHDNDYGFQSHY